MRAIKTRPSTCLFCDKTFPTMHRLETHSLVHTGERPFPCQLCSKTFQLVGNLTAHLKTHTKERPFSCPECGLTFAWKHAYVGHLKTHDPHRVRFECQICKQTLSDKFSLRGHMKRFHTPGGGERTYKCGTCSKGFVTTGDLRQHQLSHQVNRRRPFQCGHCKKTYLTSSHLKQHVKNGHLSMKSFKCSTCDKRFRHESSLVHHLKVGHKKATYKCDLCSERFKSPWNRRFHMLKRHHVPLTNLECLFCGKLYVFHGSLYDHLRDHLGEAFYSCLCCDKAFVMNRVRRDHERKMKRGRNTYKECARGVSHPKNRVMSYCPFCDKSFPNQNLTELHITGTHTGERHFWCEDCGKELSCELNLDFHKLNCVKVSEWKTVR